MTNFTLLLILQQQQQQQQQEEHQQEQQEEEEQEEQQQQEEEQEEQEEDFVFPIGTTVMVASRTTPYINKGGGVGRITTNNKDNTYNVKYVLGGTETSVHKMYITVQVFTGKKERKVEKKKKNNNNNNNNNNNR